MEKSDLDFVIELVKYEDVDEIDRLDPLTMNEKLLGLNIQKLVIPVSASKSLSSIIETAVADHILKRSGIDGNESFKQRVLEEIKKKEENIND